MCEHCGTAGRCGVCGHVHGTDDLRAMIRNAERELAAARQLADDWAAHLERLRKLDGRRPGDGSDQLRLFDAARTPSMF